MKGKAAAGLLLVAILASAGAGYIAGVSNQKTVTLVSNSTSISTATAVLTLQSPYSECGFVKSCSTTNPAGMTLSVNVSTTTFEPNGSLTISMSEFNPTEHYVNLSLSNNWYLSNLPSIWFCYDGSPPFGIEIFRGHYTLQNVTTAKDIINLSEFLPPGCIYGGNVTGFSFKPESSFVAIGAVFGTFNPETVQFYAIDGGTIKTGNNTEDVYSLWSSKPAAYTIAVGDEWGDLVLLHFSVT